MTRQCPACRNPVALDAQGDHLTCGVCRTHFCAKCQLDFGKNAENDEVLAHLADMHGDIRVPHRNGAEREVEDCEEEGQDEEEEEEDLPKFTVPRNY